MHGSKLGTVPLSVADLSLLPIIVQISPFHIKKINYGKVSGSTTPNHMIARSKFEVQREIY